MAKRKPARKTPARKAAKRVTRKAPARRRAPSIAAQKAAAARLYESFHGAKPAFRRMSAPKPAKALMSLGRLEAVIYQTPDGKRYKHEFRGASRPILAATHDGRRLVVQGGRYRMTWRGIVDKRK